MTKLNRGYPYRKPTASDGKSACVANNRTGGRLNLGGMGQWTLARTKDKTTGIERSIQLGLGQRHKDRVLQTWLRSAMASFRISILWEVKPSL